MKQLSRGRVGLWASVGLLALMVIPMAASAATLNVDVLCSTGPGTPLLPFFLAGHAEVNAAGDLTVQLTGKARQNYLYSSAELSRPYAR